jgi:SAM-dependent methyltransferase
MHDTAYKYCELFYDAYIKDTTSPINVVELGSQNVNGSIRPIFNNNPLITYTGIDYADGRGVDIIMADPYKIPLPDNSVDVIVTSSCFEHIEMFWVMYLELMRVLRPTGLLYVSAPSNIGTFHRHPVDCWRFNPDAGMALAKWGRYNGYNCTLVESFIGTKMNDIWLDFTSVFIKDERFITLYPNRIVHATDDYVNGVVNGNENITNYREFPE